MSSVEDIVHHYQKSIEKAANDEQRLLHCINKLCKLPVTVQHLQETGIGRTVNSLRKFDGEVGAKAKALVTKWKEMVAAEESSENEGDDSEKSDDDNVNSDHEAEGTPNSSPESRKPPKIEIKIKTSDEPQLMSDPHNYQYKEEKSKHRKEVKHKENEVDNDCDLNENGHKLKHQHHSSASKSSSHSKSHIPSNSKSSNGHQNSSTSSHNKDKNRDSEKHSHSSHKHEKSTTHSNSSSSSKRKRDDSLSDKLSDIEESKLIIDDEKSKSSKKNKSEHKSSTSSSHHHSSSSSSKHRDHSKSKEAGSSSSHSKSKHEKSRKDNDDHVKEKSTSSHHQNGEHDTKHLREITPPQNDVKPHRSEKSSKEKRHKSSEGETKTNDSNKTAKKRVHESDDEIDGDGIDQSTGASFAEALGMLEPGSSKKTPKKRNQSPVRTKPEKSQPSTPTSNSTSTSSTKVVKPSASKSSTSKSSTVQSTSSTSSTPSLLSSSVHLKPLEADLSLDLVPPTISNNYKPMPLNPIVMDCVFYNNKPQKKIMTEEEALGASISSKTMRTKVYCGTKTIITVVPPLLELCIRVLQKNIDALEFTGGVPFDILKPILDRASAEQLFNFEHYNPYLMEDSDVLWQGHCNQKFKGKKRLEMESWREMFIRCLEERESKLASLTENIKKTQVQAVPLKQTKLAYIDSTAKAPRNIRNKQIQFGTDRKLITTPAARVASLSNVTSNIGQVGDARLKVAAGSRDYAQVQQGPSSKPRKAPLMQKAMQLMKGRFKR